MECLDMAVFFAVSGSIQNASKTLCSFIGLYL